MCKDIKQGKRNSSNVNDNWTNSASTGNARRHTTRAVESHPASGLQAGVSSQVFQGSGDPIRRQLPLYALTRRRPAGLETPEQCREFDDVDRELLLLVTYAPRFARSKRRSVALPLLWLALWDDCLTMGSQPAAVL